MHRPGVEGLTECVPCGVYSGFAASVEVYRSVLHTLGIRVYGS